MHNLVDKLAAFWTWLFGGAGESENSRDNGPWRDDLPLLELASTGFWFWRKADIWRLGHACLSVFFVGAPGSGKSSALAFFIRCGLRIRAGALFLVYKKDEAAKYTKMVRQAGHGRDVIVVSPGVETKD